MGTVTRGDRTYVVLAGAAVTPFLICLLLSTFRDSVANTHAALVLVLGLVAVALSDQVAVVLNRAADHVAPEPVVTAAKGDGSFASGAGQPGA